MGTKKFGIKTFESFTSPVVEYIKKVYDEGDRSLPITPGSTEQMIRGYDSFSIDIHQISSEDEETKKPIRDLTRSIAIELIPDWVNIKSFENHIAKVINTNEDPNDVLCLAVRLVCPKINYVIESKRIPLTEISKKTPIKFQQIDLDDVVGKIEITSELIRTKGTNPSNSTIAFSNYTILSRNRTVSFFIDEIEDIGGNSLQIEPGDIKDKLFEMKNGEPLGVDPPKLIYHEDFKMFFNNGDDYNTVQAILILIGLPYCECLLKWIVFGKPNFAKDEHRVLIKFICELCETREKDFEDIASEADAEKKSKKYILLSSQLFSNIQKMGKGWKKMLNQIIQSEIK